MIIQTLNNNKNIIRKYRRRTIGLDNACVLTKARLRPQLIDKLADEPKNLGTFIFICTHKRTHISIL